MKKLACILLAISILVLYGCEEENNKIKNNNTEDNNEAVTENQIGFLKTKSGGCNTEGFSNLKNATEKFKDTVEITILNNDTLNVFVGINYICCAPFTAEANIVNDTLMMEISDTCSSVYGTCYCRCSCYYTWDFQFVDFAQKEYSYSVKLNDPRVENTINFKQGLIDLSK